MAMIRPSSDLRNHYNEISEFCHRTNQPVYITKNGAGDLVVLSNDDYEHLINSQADYFKLIEEGIADEQRRSLVPARAAIEQLTEELGIKRNIK